LSNDRNPLKKLVADAVRIEPVSASKFPDMRESAGYFCSDQCRTRPAFSLPSQAILLIPCLRLEVGFAISIEQAAKLDQKYAMADRFSS